MKILQKPSILFHSLLISKILSLVTGAAFVPTMSNSEPTQVRQDEIIPTITMGPIAQYYDYQGNDKVEKRSVAIFPTGFIDKIPEDGIHVVFGPDMQSDMDKVLNDKCKNPKDMQDCQNTLAKLLEESTLKLHTKRFILITAFTVAEIFGNLVAAAVGAVVGAGLGTGINVLKAPPSINFADTGSFGALAQLNAYKNASAIAIATGADNGVMATISVATMLPSPTQAPDEGVQVKEVTQDGEDGKKGDINIDIPNSVLNRLLDYLGMWGLGEVQESCKNSQQRKRGRRNLDPRAPPSLTIQCQRRLAQLAGATLIATNDVLRQIIPANPNNPLNPANRAGDGIIIPNVNVGEIPLVTLLVREWFGPETPGVDVLNEFLMRASVVVEFVKEAALDGIVMVEDITRLQMLHDEDIRKARRDEIFECPPELRCLDDDCKGYVEVGPTFPIFVPKERFQTPFCTEGKNRGCFCRELDDPIIYEVEDISYFDELQKWIEELDSPTPEAKCDSSNKISVDPKKFRERIDSACHDHNELKKRGLNGWDWDTVDQEHFQWSFDWNDQTEQCDISCADTFEFFEDDDNCVWEDGMSKSGYIKTDCGIASYSVDNPSPAVCWPYDFGAPRGRKEVDHEGGVGVSVDEALEQFCNDIDGQQVTGDVEFARRHGFGEWGVKDRRSYWLRAQYAPRDGCQGYEWVHKTNCKAVIKQAMEQCTPGQGRTNGFLVPGIGCIDYSIHVTDDVHDENPPWKDPTPMWPAPYTAPREGGYNKPICAYGSQPGRALTEDDLNKAIDYFCQDGAEIKGYGVNWKYMTDYPPAGQPQFYPTDRYWYHLTMGAASVNQGDPEPYDNMDWCKNYDWKLGKDDCTFALRKLHHDCMTDGGRLFGGDFTYRCVHYRSWGINMQNCDRSAC